MEAVGGETHRPAYDCLGFRFGLMTSVIFSTESLAKAASIASSSFFHCLDI